MTANAGYHAYATGDVLTAAQVQYNLQNQTVMYFATTTARDAALTGAILVEGMVSYTPATGVMVYNGSAWVSPGTASPLTTKGDVWGYSTTNARVPVGTNNQVLTADSTTALGVKWATPSSGSMTLLSTTTLSGTSTTISSIDQSYINLYILIENPYVASSGGGLRINPNSTALSMNWQIVQGAGVNYGSTISTDAVATSSSPANQNISLTISNYSDTTYGKPMIAYGQVVNNNGLFLSTNGYFSASAITAIQITTSGGTVSFSGGRVLIYGVK